MTVKIHVDEDIDLDGYTLVEGFPGIGLVGTISVGYLSEQDGMEEIGYISSDKFPPIASIHNGRPTFPTRIYINKDKKILLLFSEFVIPTKTVYDVSEEILNWVEQNGITQILSLAGMTTGQEPSEEPQIYGMATTNKTASTLKKHDIEEVQEGITTGVSGVLMAKCTQKKFPALSLLAQASHDYPDPKAAAHLLEKLNEITSLDVETTKLKKEAKKIHSKVKKLMKQLKSGQEEYTKAEKKSPMYR